MAGFHDAVNEQIGHEFAASQQYIAIAVWFDAETLPNLAAHFYRQAVEERNHAMMLVQFLLDADRPVAIPAVTAPKTDFRSTSERTSPERSVRSVLCSYKQTSAGSFNHLVGPGEHRWWHGEAECLGGLEVHHQFELDWLFDRQIGRLRTLENLVSKARGATI